MICRSRDYGTEVFDRAPELFNYRRLVWRRLEYCDHDGENEAED